jgi:predicted RNA-binding protein with PIN domain
MTLLIDGNNVMGAAVGGWWRDPPRAVRGLIERLQCYAAATGESVEIVLDVPHADFPEGEHDGVIVRYATRRGRDAADDRIAELVAERGGEGIEVITSDRGLSARVKRHGAQVTGARSLLWWLDASGC